MTRSRLRPNVHHELRSDLEWAALALKKAKYAVTGKPVKHLGRFWICRFDPYRHLFLMHPSAHLASLQMTDEFGRANREYFPSPKACFLRLQGLFLRSRAGWVPNPPYTNLFQRHKPQFSLIFLLELGL